MSLVTHQTLIPICARIFFLLFQPVKQHFSSIVKYI
uniref:Uncharacterized protein n=1 Tax=Rhizophora mucronata TaxID=61149 RepID=A0A2P2MZ48_RHIMU